MKTECTHSGDDEISCTHCDDETSCMH